MLRYHLNDLTWQEFEHLCQTLLQAKFGIAVEIWGGSGDRGRDAYCDFDLPLVDGVSSKGPFLFQVKHVTSASSESALQSAVNAECKEIEKRVAAGTWHPINHYMLLTNLEVKDDLKAVVEASMKKVLPTVTVLSRWGNDICSLLEAFPQTKLRYPQLLDIRDIDHILSGIVTDAIHAETLIRSRLLLERAKRLRAVFSPTESYASALEKLSEYYLVVLTGAPEMGKTAIAQMIAWSMVDAGWKAISCSEPREFFALRRSIADPTIFIAYDAFGTTEYEPGKARPWVESLGEIIPLLDQKHWLIWTARTTPFKLALRRLRIDYAHRNFPSPADVEVNASQLTLKEKAYIFFQHCRQASFDDSVKTIVRDYAEVVVKDDKFTPERIRRFVTEQLSDELPRIMAGSFTRDDVLRLVREGIDRATEEMVKSFEMLEEDLQAVLIAMLDAGTASVQHQSLEESCVRLFDRGDLLNSLADLEGHFLHRIPRQARTGTESSGTGDNYEWIHPSWRDVVIDWVAANDRLRESFLSRCGVRGLALALSEGGGADGKRSLPFLRSEEDWNYLHVHLPGIVGASDVASHKLLYDTLLEIAEKAGSDQLKVHIEHLRRLIIETLRSSRARWDTDAKAIEVRFLDAYYRLSEAVGEVEPSPRLQATWSSTESLWSKIENADFVQEIDLSPLEDAIWLIKILAENEPRFLKVVDFPGQYLPVFKKLLGLIGEYDYDGISRNRESYRGEENYIDELAAVTTKILRIAPSLQNECDNARSKLHERNVKLTEEIEQMDEEPSSSVTAQAKIHAIPKVGNAQTFSVNELFATL